MKKLIFSVLLILSYHFSFALCGFYAPNNTCFRYDAVTGKVVVELTYVSGTPGLPPCVDFYLANKGWDPLTSSYIMTQTYMYVKDPSSSGFFGPFTMAGYTPITCGGPGTGFPYYTCGYTFYYEINFPGISTQECYDMYIMSDYPVPTDVTPYVPVPGINPAVNYPYLNGSYVASSGAFRVCACEDSDPTPVCNAKFNFQTEYTDFSAPGFIGTVLPYEYHPTSTYFFEYGDGYTSILPQSHIYAPGAGSYTVCMTEYMADGSCCKWCIDFCGMTGYDGVAFCGPSMMKTGKGAESGATPSGNNTMLYPNPSNGKTELRFDLENEASVQVNIMDITGKSVAEYAPQKFGKGVSKMELPTQNLAPGTYQVRVLKGKEAQFLKLSVIK